MARCRDGDAQRHRGTVTEPGTGMLRDGAPGTGALGDSTGMGTGMLRDGATGGRAGPGTGEAGDGSVWGRGCAKAPGGGPHRAGRC